MTKFLLRVDRQVKTWVRDTMTVEADTLEEAISKALDDDFENCDSVEMAECEEDLGPVEIYDSQFNLVYSHDIHSN